MYKFAVIPGDGIGVEVTAEAMKVLKCVAEVKDFKYETKNYPHSGDHYLETGELFPEELFDELKKMDGIFLGAIGDPRLDRGLLERAIVGGVRFKLDLFINLRPIVCYAEQFCPLKNKKAEDIDMIVVRENTEGAYSQIGGFLKKGFPEEVSIQNMVYTRHGVERVVRYAYELAMKRNKLKRLTLCDKANALPSHDIWRRTFREVGEEYSEIERDEAYVDATCMWMVKNPEWFDVIVTPNLFGDIITDLGAMLQGGMGIAAGGNIHPGKVSMFEPIHGSAPKYRGKNVANPLAAICACGMLLDHIGENEGADLVENAVANLLRSGKIKDISARSGFSTTQIGDMVIEEIDKMK